MKCSLRAAQDSLYKIVHRKLGKKDEGYLGITVSDKLQSLFSRK